MSLPSSVCAISRGWEKRSLLLNCIQLHWRVLQLGQANFANCNQILGYVADQNCIGNFLKYLKKVGHIFLYQQVFVLYLLLHARSICVYLCNFASSIHRLWNYGKSKEKIQLKNTIERKKTHVCIVAENCSIETSHQPFDKPWEETGRVDPVRIHLHIWTGCEAIDLPEYVSCWALFLDQGRLRLKNTRTWKKLNYRD